MVLTAAALAFAGAAAGCDLAWRRVPNWLTVPGLGAGLLLAYYGGWPASAALAAVAGLGIGFVLWRLGAVGGGDAKLLAALGALLGWRLWFWSLEFGLIAAGMLAAAQLLRRRRLFHMPRVAVEIVRGWGRYGLHRHPRHHVRASGAVTAPFAVPMAVGVVCALLLR